MKPHRAKSRTIADLMKRGIDPVGCHVVTATGRLGTVRGIVVESGSSFSQRLKVVNFNGELWDFLPLPSLVYVIERPRRD